MKKIPTMFERDETRKGHPVTDLVKPECEWVLAGEGVATVKIDGTNVKIAAGQLFKRQKPPDRDYDDAAYVPCDRANPADRWAYEAFDAGHDGDGIYELVGPEVQGNPQQHATHTLIRVVPVSRRLQGIDAEVRSVYYGRTFEGLKKWLVEHPVEGVVFHHPNGRMAKIKRRDYGLPWPTSEKWQ
jgi:hypothetical protein